VSNRALQTTLVSPAGAVPHVSDWHVAKRQPSGAGQSSAVAQQPDPPVADAEQRPACRLHVDAAQVDWPQSSSGVQAVAAPS